jgi:hypothetical protein
MIKAYRMILKSGMEIGLSGMAGIARLGKQGQVGQSQLMNQAFGDAMRRRWAGVISHGIEHHGENSQQSDAEK